MNLAFRGLSLITVISLLAMGEDLRAQSMHSDIRFWYESGKIETETDNGLHVGTGIFATSGIFQQYDANPGFASEVDVGMGINAGDIIVYNVLDNLQYWDGESFSALPDGVQLRIENNAGPETVVDNSSGLQLGSNVAPFANAIDQANSAGDFHAHVDYFLEPLPESAPPTPAFGVYGLKLSLSTDAVGIADSDPFFFVFNFGLSSQLFAEAVDAFADLLDRIPGDYDGDGDVDGRDFIVWQRDPDVGNLADWQMYYGTGIPLSVAATAVPEPGTIWLATIAFGGIVSRGLRSRSRFKNKGMPMV